MRVHQRLIAALSILITALSPLGAQEAATDALAGDTLGWHVVRPGDTLEDITAFYLGATNAWEQNWQLNPGIRDPHLLFPGERVRVILQERLPAGSAQVQKIGNAVEEQPTPIAWRQAFTEDLLRERDGIRTAEDSSAELLFADGTRLTVSEDSLLFLRSDTLPKAERETRERVEIMVGQADLSGTAPPRQESGVEILLGPARAVTSTDDTGRVQTRARRDDKDSKLMVYAGSSQVESGGETVQVAAGSGVAIPPQGPPEPPEVLLPAPTPAFPPAGSSLAFGNPHFSWTEIDGAASYTVEICRDPECGQLAARYPDVAASGWQPNGLPLGDLHWRVTARSGTGLDGFPSDTLAIQVTDSRLVQAMPIATFSPDGPQSGLGTRAVLGVGTILGVKVSDPTGGPSIVELSIDEQPVTSETWSEGLEPGDHFATAQVFGANGGHTTVGPWPIIFDPVAPVLEHRVGDQEILLSHALDQDVEPEAPKRKIKTDRSVEVLWSTHGIQWLPLLPPGQASARWDVFADSPQVFLWTRTNQPFAPEAGVRFEKGQVLQIKAADEHSAVQNLALSVQDGVLHIEATDLVGNQSRLTWPLGR